MERLGCLTIFLPNSEVELSLENTDKVALYNKIKTFMKNMFKELGYPDSYTIINEKNYVKLNSYLLGLFLALVSRTKYVELSNSEKTSIPVSIKLFKELINDYMREFPSYHIAVEPIASYVQQVLFDTFSNIILKNDRIELTKMNILPMVLVDENYIKFIIKDNKINENIINKVNVKEAYLIATDDY